MALNWTYLGKSWLMKTRHFTIQFPFVRYANDFVARCPNANQTQEVRLLFEQTLNGLGLILNENHELSKRL